MMKHYLFSFDFRLQTSYTIFLNNLVERKFRVPQHGLAEEFEN